MVTLTIDDQTFAKLKQRASACGLTVEEWLKIASSGSEAPPTDQECKEAEVSYESWHKKFMEYVNSHEPTGTPLDISRESMYD